MILDQFNNKIELKLHLDWISKYYTILKFSHFFEAAVIVGSFAKGNADRLSDIDLVVFATKNHFEEAAQILFSIQTYDKIHSFSKSIPGQLKLEKVIYDNFVSAEIHLFSTHFEFRLSQPYITLKDTNNFLDAKTISGPPPTYQDFSALNHGVEGLGWELFDLFKWWQRGNRELVLNHLKKLSNALNGISK